MKKLSGVLIGLLLVVNLAACGTTIPPGHVGIVVNQYGSDKGVDSYPAQTGRVWYNPITTSVIEYPTFVQNVVWTKDPNEGHPTNEEITFTTGDQMKVDADISLAYQLDMTKAPAFYVKFRADDIDTFTHGFMRNLAREKFDNIAGKYKIEQIMGDNAQFLKETQVALQADIAPYGINIVQFGFIGAPRPPQAVVESINAKVKATQDAQMVENQLRQTQAEAQKNVAKAEGDAKAAIAKAEGEAKANAILSASINQNLLAWQALDIQRGMMFRWNGALPVTVAGGAVPFLNIGPIK